MKEIPLRKRHSHLSAIVDDDDYDRLIKYKWYGLTTPRNKGREEVYAYRVERRNKKQVAIKMHDEIMYLEHGSPLQIDHINHVHLDNRKKNLRITSEAQNRRNKRSYRNSSSKYRGVSFDKETSKWVAYVCLNKKMKKLGRYNTELEAADVAQKAVDKRELDFKQKDEEEIDEYRYTILK